MVCVGRTCHCSPTAQLHLSGPRAHSFERDSRSLCCHSRHSYRKHLIPCMRSRYVKVVTSCCIGQLRLHALSASDPRLRHAPRGDARPRAQFHRNATIRDCLPVFRISHLDALSSILLARAPLSTSYPHSLSSHLARYIVTYSTLSEVGAASRRKIS